VEGSNRCEAEVGKLKVASRLSAAGQVLQSNDSRRRIMAFVFLLGDRRLHLKQLPFESAMPLDLPSDSIPPERPPPPDPALQRGHDKGVLLDL
jgi:hypothetical protein